MKSFKDFIKEGQVKKVSADAELAKSLVTGLQERAKYVLGLKVEERGTTIIFENIYDCLREALDAILALEGYKSYSHEAPILYLKNFKEFTETDLALLDKFRNVGNFPPVSNWWLKASHFQILENF